ncbi:hypothetical protein SNEBB_005209 [Seison nebaliae]|nr:hypothetical protein SNEBB_005209 [Seison nebaliae]
MLQDSLNGSNDEPSNEKDIKSYAATRLKSSSKFAKENYSRQSSLLSLSILNALNDDTNNENQTRKVETLDIVTKPTKLNKTKLSVIKNEEELTEKKFHSDINSSEHDRENEIHHTVNDEVERNDVKDENYQSPKNSLIHPSTEDNEAIYSAIPDSLIEEKDIGQTPSSQIEPLKILTRQNSSYSLKSQRKNSSKSQKFTERQNSENLETRQKSSNSHEKELEKRPKSHIENLQRKDSSISQKSQRQKSSNSKQRNSENITNQSRKNSSISKKSPKQLIGTKEENENSSELDDDIPVPTVVRKNSHRSSRPPLSRIKTPSLAKMDDSIDLQMRKDEIVDNLTSFDQDDENNMEDDTPVPKIKRKTANDNGDDQHVLLESPDFNDEEEELYRYVPSRMSTLSDLPETFNDGHSDNHIRVSSNIPIPINSDILNNSNTSQPTSPTNNISSSKGEKSKYDYKPDYQYPFEYNIDSTLDEKEENIISFENPYKKYSEKPNKENNENKQPRNSIEQPVREPSKLTKEKDSIVEHKPPSTSTNVSSVLTVSSRESSSTVVMAAHEINNEEANWRRRQQKVTAKRTASQRKPIIPKSFSTRNLAPLRRTHTHTSNKSIDHVKKSSSKYILLPPKSQRPSKDFVEKNKVTLLSEKPTYTGLFSKQKNTSSAPTQLTNNYAPLPPINHETIGKLHSSRESQTNLTDRNEISGDLNNSRVSIDINLRVLNGSQENLQREMPQSNNVDIPIHLDSAMIKEALENAMKNQLRHGSEYSTERPRKVSYKKYNLKDYSDLKKQFKGLNKGSLGPDVHSDALRYEQDKAGRRNEYANQVKEKNKKEFHESRQYGYAAQLKDNRNSSVQSFHRYGNSKRSDRLQADVKYERSMKYANSLQLRNDNDSAPSKIKVKHRTPISTGVTQNEPEKPILPLKRREYGEQLRTRVDGDAQFSLPPSTTEKSQSYKQPQENKRIQMIDYANGLRESKSDNQSNSNYAQDDQRFNELSERHKADRQQTENLYAQYA